MCDNNYEDIVFCTSFSIGIISDLAILIFFCKVDFFCSLSLGNDFQIYDLDENIECIFMLKGTYNVRCQNLDTKRF